MKLLPSGPFDEYVPGTMSVPTMYVPGPKLVTGPEFVICGAELGARQLAPLSNAVVKLFITNDVNTTATTHKPPPIPANDLLGARQGYGAQHNPDYGGQHG